VPAAASRPAQVHVELSQESDPGMGITQRIKITTFDRSLETFGLYGLKFFLDSGQESKP
jgi:hypothetical protein